MRGAVRVGVGVAKSAVAAATFQSDVKYEVGESLTKGGRQAAQLTLDMVANASYSSGIVLGFVNVVEENGERLVDAIMPRYEAAFDRANSADLIEIFERGLTEYIAMAATWYVPPVGRVRDGLYDQALVEAKQRLHDRMRHGIRWVTSKPAKPWRERHSNLDRLLAAAGGFVLAIAAQAVIKVLGLA